MNKWLCALVTCMAILATNGLAVAQDESRTTMPDTQQDTQRDTQRDTQPDTRGDTQRDAQPDAGTPPAPLEPGELVISEKEQEYLAALTECESLSGGQKKPCIEAVKEKFGHD